MQQLKTILMQHRRILLVSLLLTTGLFVPFFIFHGSAYADGPVIPNASFETPSNISSQSGGFAYQPSGGSWAFGHDTGIAANGSVFNNPNAPDGSQQVAILQSNAGAITQSISGFQANTSYAFTFSAAKRNYGGAQSIQVSLGSTSLGIYTPGGTSFADITTSSVTPGAGTFILTFAGTAGCDCTAFIDNIRLITLPTIPNSGFETPSVSGQSGGFAYQPSGGSWAFGPNTGIAANGSVFNNPNAPDGSQQVAILQSNTGAITQSLNGFQAATSYVFTFAVAKRNYGGAQNIQVSLGSTSLGTFTPTSTNFTDMTTNVVTPGAGTFALTFAGTAGCDCTAFIDNIRIATATAVVKPILGAFFFDGQFIAQAQAGITLQGAAPAPERGSWLTDYDYQQSTFGWYDASDTFGVGHTIPYHAQIVNEEIDAAANSGLNYLSFDWYGNTSGLDGALHDYLASPKKSEINYTLMPVASFLVTSGWESTYVPYLVQRFQETQYQKLPGNRPLMYLFNSSDWISKFGSNALGEINYLRSQAQAAGLGNPYIVETSGNASGAATLQLDAVTSYGPGDHGGYPHVTYQTRTSADASDNAATYSNGLARVYDITASADGRAVNCFGENAGWVDLPTYSQWEQNLASVYTQLQQQPSNAATPPLAVIYAWGEVQEGGPGLLPTVQEGNRFLDAIHAVTTNSYPSVYFDTVNDSYVNNGNDTGLSYSSSNWSYNGPPSSSCNSGTSHTTDANGDQLWGFYGNDETTTSTTGATAAVTYDNATGFRLIAATGPNRGQVDVTVDGQDQGVKDLYSASMTRQQIIFDDEGQLSQGTHTVQVTVLASKNSSSSGNLVGIDAVQVQRQRLGTPVSSPPPPQVVVAQGYESRVEVSWSVVHGATTYQIYRGTANQGPYSLVNTIAAPSTASVQITYTDGGLSNGTTYYYVVKAVTGATTSDASSQTNAIPTPNLTVGGTYSDSSELAGQGAANAFDNNLSTNWQATSGSVSTPQYVEADFAGGASQSFNRVKLWGYGNQTTFSIQYWNGSAWATAYTGTNIGDFTHPREITFQQVYGSKVRVVFSGNANPAIVYECEVYLR